MLLDLLQILEKISHSDTKWPLDAISYVMESWRLTLQCNKFLTSIFHCDITKHTSLSIKLCSGLDFHHRVELCRVRLNVLALDQKEEEYFPEVEAT